MSVWLSISTRDPNPNHVPTTNPIQPNTNHKPLANPKLDISKRRFLVLIDSRVCLFACLSACPSVCLFASISPKLRNRPSHNFCACYRRPWLNLGSVWASCACGWNRFADFGLWIAQKCVYLDNWQAQTQGVNTETSQNVKYELCSGTSAGFWLVGSMRPCRTRRRTFWKFDYEMVHSEVYLNKYVVSIAPFSTPACPDCSQNIT